MALILCPECGKQMSDKASACPHCGAPYSAAPAVHHINTEQLFHALARLFGFHTLRRT